MLTVKGLHLRKITIGKLLAHKSLKDDRSDIRIKCTEAPPKEVPHQE